MPLTNTPIYNSASLQRTQSNHAMRIPSSVGLSRRSMSISERPQDMQLPGVHVSENNWAHRIEDFELKHPIGYGSSAVVYEAICKPTQQRVAIKLLDLDMFERHQIDELRRETALMALSKHPNVLRVHGSFVSGSKLYIVTPYLSAGSCLDIMKTSFADGFEEITIATILKQTLEGIVYLHKNGHIHRDVKCGNLLMDEHGTVMLADFGVSSSLSANGDKRRTFVGTPCWMAPEVMEQTSSGYDYKADIWSFGITCIELATGHAPFSKFPPLKVLMMTINKESPTLNRDTTRHKYTKVFKEMIDMCLQKDPTKRPTAEKLLQHPFFKQAKKKDYLTKSVLVHVTPLDQRPHKKIPLKHISFQTTEQWDFDPPSDSEGYSDKSQHSTDNPPPVPAASVPPSSATYASPPEAPRKHITFSDTPTTGDGRPSSVETPPITKPATKKTHFSTDPVPVYGVGSDKYEHMQDGSYTGLPQDELLYERPLEKDKSSANSSGHASRSRSSSHAALLHDGLVNGQETSTVDPKTPHLPRSPPLHTASSSLSLSSLQQQQQQQQQQQLQTWTHASWTLPGWTPSTLTPTSSAQSTPIVMPDTNKNPSTPLTVGLGISPQAMPQEMKMRKGRFSVNQPMPHSHSHSHSHSLSHVHPPHSHSHSHSHSLSLSHSHSHPHTPSHSPPQPHHLSKSEKDDSFEKPSLGSSLPPGEKLMARFESIPISRESSHSSVLSGSRDVNGTKVSRFSVEKEMSKEKEGGGGASTPSDMVGSPVVVLPECRKKGRFELTGGQTNSPNIDTALNVYKEESFSGVVSPAYSPSASLLHGQSSPLETAKSNALKLQMEEMLRQTDHQRTLLQEVISHWGPSSSHSAPFARGRAPSETRQIMDMGGSDSHSKYTSMLPDMSTTIENLQHLLLVSTRDKEKLVKENEELKRDIEKLRQKA
ncbi:hypothetical protein BDF14DRAFT_1782209 [Spinellus fusiger]|nr:hypothetical protein BDF14DRAFT_1782209 [Spinellus fusiger]